MIARPEPPPLHSLLCLRRQSLSLQSLYRSLSPATQLASLTRRLTFPHLNRPLLQLLFAPKLSLFFLFLFLSTAVALPRPPPPPPAAPLLLPLPAPLLPLLSPVLIRPICRIRPDPPGLFRQPSRAPPTRTPSTSPSRSCSSLGLRSVASSELDSTRRNGSGLWNSGVALPRDREVGSSSHRRSATTPGKGSRFAKREDEDARRGPISGSEPLAIKYHSLDARALDMPTTVGGAL
ncbi:hypothetical protein Mapa_012288 [Marchantia paleacea]|nr:hypothetical protein Mapa_012288 [Marchantia paleacea]